MAPLARVQPSWDHMPLDTCFRADANVSHLREPQGGPGGVLVVSAVTLPYPHLSSSPLLSFGWIQKQGTFEKGAMDSAEKKEGLEKLAPRKAVSSLVKTELMLRPHGPSIVTKPRKQSTPLPGLEKR